MVGVFHGNAGESEEAGRRQLPELIRPSRDQQQLWLRQAQGSLFCVAGPCDYKMYVIEVYRVETNLIKYLARQMSCRCPTLKFSPPSAMLCSRPDVNEVTNLS